MESRIYKITFFGVILAINMVISGSGAAAAELIVHSGGSIQAAINNSVPGDLIIVEPGTYEGNISINTRDLVIISQSGNPDNTIIKGPEFYILTSNITINGFTLNGSGDSSGILIIDRTGNCRIENNKIMNYMSGIEIPTGSKLNVISENKIYNCQEGISVSEGLKNIVNDNKIINCQSGIVFREGNGNRINLNELSLCQNGITYMEGFENIVSDNKVSDCGDGISVGNGDATLIENRTLIEKNSISENNVGVSVNGGGGYTVKDNKVILNNKSGYEDYSTGTNYVYNNYFNNSVNVKLGSNSRYGSPITWSIPLTAGTNIMGGPYIGGNYWAAPSGNGFSQTHSDINGDGICEGQYSFNGEDVDYLPLITSSQKTEFLLPVANFSMSVNFGSAPLSVTFTDLSQNETARLWDFTSDGNTDSFEENPTYVYAVPGTYTVNLTIINGNIKASKLGTVTVTEENVNNSGNNESSVYEIKGRSHGKEDYGSHEPANNIEAKELAQAFVINGKTVKFEFVKNVTCVVYLSFDAKKTEGKTTANVEMLKGKSALVSTLPFDPVYKSFNILVGDGKLTTLKSIENPVIFFKVENSWVQNNSIDKSSIALSRYNGKEWEQCPTSLVKEDSKYLYFTANVSNFSSFTITGEEKRIERQNKTDRGLKLDNKIGNSHNKENNGFNQRQEEIKNTPCFEIWYGVTCLLGALLYKRNKSLR